MACDDPSPEADAGLSPAGATLAPGRSAHAGHWGSGGWDNCPARHKARAAAPVHDRRTARRRVARLADPPRRADDPGGAGTRRSRAHGRAGGRSRDGHDRSRRLDLADGPRLGALRRSPRADRAVPGIGLPGARGRLRRRPRIEPGAGRGPGDARRPEPAAGVGVHWCTRARGEPAHRRRHDHAATGRAAAPGHRAGRARDCGLRSRARRLRHAGRRDSVPAAPHGVRRAPRHHAARRAGPGRSSRRCTSGPLSSCAGRGIAIG